MARPREFDPDKVLDGAIKVFSEHGYEGASARMLVDEMGIGLQSLYAAFGDKWQLYCSAVHRYGMGECAAHLDALRSGSKAIDGVAAMLRRVVKTAAQPCLGVGSTYEFGDSKPEVIEINNGLARSLRKMIAGRVREAQRQGDVTMEIEPASVADYLVCCIAGIRVAGRGGASKDVLNGLVDTALRALR